MGSGYTYCACCNCFETIVSSDVKHPDLCADCQKAGCNQDGSGECQAIDFGEIPEESV